LFLYQWSNDGVSCVHRDDGDLKMASPTSSIESIPAANSIESEFRSISPLSLSNSSPLTVNGSSNSSSGSSSHSFSGLSGSILNSKCGLCHDTNAKILPCYHSYCETCLERDPDHPDKLTCPSCQQECVIPSFGLAGLLSDLTLNSALTENIIEESVNNKGPRCTGCRGSDYKAVARCVDCSNYLCPNCVMAHQYMHCFEGHRVMNLSDLSLQSGGVKEELKVPLNGTNGDKTMSCPRHKNDALKYFCRTCNVPICKECTLLDHPSGLHDYEYISEVGSKQVS